MNARIASSNAAEDRRREEEQRVSSARYAASTLRGASEAVSGSESLDGRSEIEYARNTTAVASQRSRAKATVISYGAETQKRKRGSAKTFEGKRKTTRIANQKAVEEALRRKEGSRGCGSPTEGRIEEAK